MEFKVDLKRHIIIEGPDGAGKTTLAKQLAHLTGKEYHHEGPPPKDVDTFQHYMTLLLQNRPTVFDRLYAGERVYGPILRGYSALSFEQVRLLNSAALVHARTVYVNPGYDECRTNWLGRAMRGGELFNNDQLFDRTFRAFEEIADEFDVHYNYKEFAAR